MRLITRAQWGARPRRYINRAQLSAESTAHWEGPTIIIGGRTTWDHSKCAGLVRGIQNFHMDARGWSDIAYNFLVCPHGWTFEGRGLNVVNGANGTTSGNRSSHAICVLAGEGNPFPESERIEFRECIRHIDRNTLAPGTCKGHRDHKPTACPGDARYKWVHDGMPLKTTTSKPYGDWPYTKNKPTIRRGSTGSPVRYLQRVIKEKAGGNITVDGMFGAETAGRVTDIQKMFKLEIATYGVVGPKTWSVIDYLALR